ncbi:hypothetical protein Fmac_032145 [Flemingia macrophylla]|uniref:Uncharacterized protein n=1 Tax=Flemingia macrophylla TaxID=520843 RepID=A0ABD1L442_9FABA
MLEHEISGQEVEALVVAEAEGASYVEGNLEKENLGVEPRLRGLVNSESSDIFLSGDKFPYWLVHTGEGHSVNFTVPEDYPIKGMTLCVYLSTPENMAIECLVSVLMVNYTKCTMQIYKKDTVISFNDVDWQGIISHLGPGDKDLGWLKILNLSQSKYLKETPDVSKLLSLEKLILKDCPRLRKVHESIGDLHNLVILNLKGCKSLANLPRRA